MRASREGVRGTELAGVFFTEATIAGAPALGNVSVEISRQNANLGEVKRALAEKVKAAGGNALMQFTYGQKAHPWWQLLALKWDSESWHGAGVATRLD